MYKSGYFYGTSCDGTLNSKSIFSLVQISKNKQRPGGSFSSNGICGEHLSPIPSSAYVHLEASKKGNPVDQLLFSFFSFLYVRYSLLQRTEYEYIQLSVNSFFSSYLMVSHVKSNANNTSFVLENKDSHFASSISKRPSLRRLFKEGKKKRQSIKGDPWLVVMLNLRWYAKKMDVLYLS